VSEPSCKDCKHSQIAGRMVCRRYPPQTHFIVVLRKASAIDMKPPAPIEEQRSAFPPVNPEWYCGEFSLRVELLAS
jgi:hypothetical protein